MRRRNCLLICLYVLMTFIAPAITEAFGPQNPPSGFHELSWGVDIGNMKGFKLEKSDKYGKHYSRNNEDLAFEGVPLKSVTYKTFENKLHMVTLTFEGQSNFEKLASNSKNKYAEYSELKSEHGFNKDIEYSWYFYYFSKSEKNILQQSGLNMISQRTKASLACQICNIARRCAFILMNKNAQQANQPDWQ